MASVKEINDLLPQTQCRECGYDGCEPYASALMQRTAPLDRCSPGGVETVQMLAKILHQDPTPWLESAKARTRSPAIARIVESECIGCTKCIQACPVDAIMGSAKQMHVIMHTECTGCGLCIEPCPVDCIDLLPLPEPVYDKKIAASRFQARQIRHLREENKQQQQYREKNFATDNQPAEQEKITARQTYIQEALERVKAKKHG